VAKFRLCWGRARYRHCDFFVALFWHPRAFMAEDGPVWRRCIELYGDWLPTLRWRYVLPWAPPGQHVAHDWTGRDRELIGVRWPMGVRFLRWES